MSNKPLYDDKFLNLGNFLNSPKFQFFIGLIISLLFLYFHWIASLTFFILTLISTLASYIVFKDKKEIK